MHIGESFADVPTSHIFYRFIGAPSQPGHRRLRHAPPYCRATALRKEWRCFLLRISGDVTCPRGLRRLRRSRADPFHTDEDLADQGLPPGCGPGVYVPTTRSSKQMAYSSETLLGSPIAPLRTDLRDVPAEGSRRGSRTLQRTARGGAADSPRRSRTVPEPSDARPDGPFRRRRSACCSTGRKRIFPSSRAARETGAASFSARRTRPALTASASRLERGRGALRPRPPFSVSTGRRPPRPRCLAISSRPSLAKGSARPRAIPRAQASSLRIVPISYRASPGCLAGETRKSRWTS